MNIDFTAAPTWLQSFLLWAAIIGAILTFAATVLGFFRKVWPVLKKIVERENLLEELTPFMAEQRQFRVDTAQWLAAQDEKIAEIHDETHTNHGSSLKDSQLRTERDVAALGESMKRIELGVKGLYDRADKADKADEDLRHELEVTRPKTSTPRKRPTSKKETK